MICNRHFTGYRRYWESPGCHGFGGLSCGPKYHEAYEGYTSNIGTDGYPDQQCPGKRGTPGLPGNPWKPWEGFTHLNYNKTVSLLKWTILISNWIWLR